MRRRLHSLLLLALAALVLAAPAVRATPVPGPLPLAFEPNRGQVDPTARYFARGRGYTLYLTDDRAVFALAGDPPTSLRLKLSGADTPRALVAEQPLPGVSHYIDLASGAVQAHDVAQVARVRATAVYPGIDIVYYGQDGELEYDFVLAPGADPTRLGLELDGADAVALEADGALALRVGAKTLRFKPPVAYQTRHDGAREPVASRYELDGTRVRFALGAYDTARELVVDPVFVYASYLGGSGEDRAYDVAVNAAGEAYVTGYTCSTDFPLVNALDSSYGGSCDAYVTKFSANGSSVVFSTYLGGAEYQEGNAIALDSSGNIYVTGRNQINGTADAFELKLNAAGSAVIYSHTLNTNGYDYGFGIAADSAGNAYIIGQTDSSNFPVTAGALFPTYAGGEKGFFRKLDPNGNVLVSSYLGASTANIYGLGVGLDNAGNILLAGRTEALDPNGDAFVMKLNPAGTAITWTKRLFGSGQDTAYDVKGDGAGNIYVAGSTNSSDFPLTGGFDVTPNGDYDALLVKLDSGGNVIASTVYGGGELDELYALALAPDGTVVASGRTGSFNWSTLVLHASNNLGTLLHQAQYTGAYSISEGVAVDSSGNAYVVSRCTGTMPATVGAFQANPPGDQNGHLGKIAWGSMPALSVSDRIRNENGANLDFPLALSPPSATPIVVSYASADGTATAGFDYTAVSGTVTIPAGATSFTINVPLLDDLADENDETILLNVSSSGATVTDGQGLGTIRDDDPMPSVAIGGCTGAEGATCTFDVTLSAPSGRAVSVQYATSDGSAVAGSDYGAGSGTLTIPAGASSAPIVVALVDDALYEGGNETFTMSIASPVNATLGASSATGTIADNDAAPTLSVDNGGCSATEAAGGSSCAFVFRLSNPTSVAVTFTTATVAGSAGANFDFGPDTGTTRTIAAGQTTLTVPIAVLDDNVDEPNESFTLNATGVSGATPASLSATGTIVDDDATPTLSVDNGGCTVTETNGTTSCTFVFRLSRPSNYTITFTTATRNGTALDGSDYSGHTATLRTFTTGTTTYNLVIPILGDTVQEADETYFIDVTGIANATPASLTATGTILNDDVVPTLSVDNGGCSVTEGNSGSVACTFVFRLSSTSTSAVTFNTQTSNGTAASGNDYTGHGVTARTIAAGQTTLTVVVPVLGDTLDETDETFTLTASSIANAAPASLSAAGTIVDDDAAPNLTIDDCAAPEGNSGTTNCPFRMHLSAASGKTVTVNWAQLPTDVPALFESFEAVSNSAPVVSYGAGAMGSWTVDSGSVDLVRDDYWQATERHFSVDLNGGAAGTIHRDFATTAGDAYRVYFGLTANPDCGTAARHMALYWNGVPLGEYTADPTGLTHAAMGWKHYEVRAGAATATSRLTFASLDAGACGPVLDDVWVVHDGTPMIPLDLPIQTGTVTFAPGQTASSVQNAVFDGDTLREPDEHFGIAVTGGSNYGSVSGGTITILNDDAGPDALFNDGFE